ncbi:MAG: hypothetical protein O2855_08210, partial [Planctomycetota bacterium]|nr:hypothetical protein [Planctomycetota bacterium]
MSADPLTEAQQAEAERQLLRRLKEKPAKRSPGGEGKGPQVRPGHRFRFEQELARHGWLAWLRRRRPSLLAVLTVLNTWADRHLVVRCSHGAIARAVGMARENVARRTKEAERLGLLRVVERGRKVADGNKGARTCNVYQLPAELPSAPSSNSVA